VACPQVLEISSVSRQPSCFGVFAVLIYWGLGSLPHLLSLSKVSNQSASPLLSACCDGLLIVFNFALLFDFGYCSLAQEMSFVDCYLLYFRQWVNTGPL
jgi:hypothetical protein